MYATTGYEASVRNLAQTSLTQDIVFGDDHAEHQLATVTGSVGAGYTAARDVVVWGARRSAAARRREPGGAARGPAPTRHRTRRAECR